MDVETFRKMTASSIIKKEKGDDSTRYTATRSRAKMKANQNHSCTSETLIKESYGLSLGREFAMDLDAEDCINQTSQLRINNIIPNTLCGMVMPCSINVKDERNAVYHGSADNIVNGKRISSLKPCSRENNDIKERPSKIIIANVPCNQDWISANAANKQCISRTEYDQFLSDSEVNESDDEIEIIDIVVKKANTNIECVVIEDDDDVDETDGIIFLGNKSKDVTMELGDNFLLEAQGSETSIWDNIPPKIFNEMTYNVSKPRVDEACNRKKSFEFRENASVDKSHEIHENTPVEEFDKALKNFSVLCQKEIPDDHRISISESTSNEEHNTSADGIQLQIESVYHLDEWEGEEVIFESYLNEPAENSIFQSENFVMPSIKKEKGEIEVIFESYLNKPTENIFQNENFLLPTIKKEKDVIEVVFESNSNEPGKTNNFQSEHFLMPTIKKEKDEVAYPNNLKISKDKQDIKSSNGANISTLPTSANLVNTSTLPISNLVDDSTLPTSSNLVNTSTLPKSSTPIENSSGDYTYVKRLSGLRPYKCSQCLFACKNKESLILHMQKCFRRRQRRERTGKKYEGKKESMECFLCSSQLENNFKLIQHLFRVHADTVNSNSVSSEIMSMIEKFEVNGSSNNSRNKIIENALRYKFGKSSNIPGKVGNSSKMSDEMTRVDVNELLYFKEPLKNTHSSTNSKCIFCGKRFYCNVDKRHVRKCIKRICSKEGYKFVTDNNGTCDKHETDSKEKVLLSTSQEDKFCCLICKKLFLRLRYLYEHLFSHTPFKPYECPFCKKGFLKRRFRSYHMQEKCKNKSLNMKISKSCKTEDFGNLKLQKLSKENCLGLRSFPETNLVKFNQGETLENYTVSAGELVNNYSACSTNYKSTTNDCTGCKDGNIDLPFQNNVAVFQKNNIKGLNNCSTSRQVDEDSSRSFSNDVFDSQLEKGDHAFCSVCSKSFEHQVDFENHWSYAHEKLSCLYCRTIFHDKINLKYHTRKCRVKLYSNVDKMGLPNRNPEKNIVKNTNIQKGNFKVHSSVLTEDTSSYINSSESYDCSFCERAFRSYYNLYRHKLVVHDGNTEISNTKKLGGENLKPKIRHFICKSCGKLFPRRAMLRLHVKDCLPSKNVKKRFRRKFKQERIYSLRRNDKYDFVGFTKPYVCLFCHMEFSDEFCFRLHKSKHSANPKVGNSKGTYDLIVRLERIDDN
ncbi:uncharacterized protein [Palaemon carinicauda]|uniref:uncharacterized protein n=1 Tax=Palaemon carinicauda TaxID=392227 RepID=UPI0035B63166